MSGIRKNVFGSLLSLAVFGLATGSVDYISEKCPYDTAKAKKVILIVILIISLLVLYSSEYSHILKK